ncbi:MAG: DUF6316 family protein [Pseudomonadota bacterium]
MSVKRKDDCGNATRFRTDRMINEDGQWYFFTREGTIEGPFSDRLQARSRLDAYIAVVTSGLLPSHNDYVVQSSGTS